MNRGWEEIKEDETEVTMNSNKQQHIMMKKPCVNTPRPSVTQWTAASGPTAQGTEPVPPPGLLATTSLPTPTQLLQLSKVTAMLYTEVGGLADVTGKTWEDMCWGPELILSGLSSFSRSKTLNGIGAAS